MPVAVAVVPAVTGTVVAAVAGTVVPDAVAHASNVCAAKPHRVAEASDCVTEAPGPVAEAPVTDAPVTGAWCVLSGVRVRLSSSQHVSLYRSGKRL